MLAGIVWLSQDLGAVWGGTGQPLMFFPSLGFWNSVLRERGSRPVAGKAFLPQLTISSSSQSLTFSAAVRGANSNEP